MDNEKEGGIPINSRWGDWINWASNLNINLESRELLNLDFEDEAKVCIGCAGGADIQAYKRLVEVWPFKYIYRVEISGLKRGTLWYRYR